MKTENEQQAETSTAPVRVQRVVRAREPVPAIRVWRYADAPEWMKELSGHGGDEDWVALVPPGMNARDINWIGDGGTPFGWCDVEYHEAPRGTVCIGAHS